MRSGHLFAGCGLGMLADKLNGQEPAWAVEIDEWCCGHLRQRVADGWFPGCRVVCADVRSVDYASLGYVDALCAGFPCQNISAAGDGTGIDGAKSALVWEVFRAIDALRPAWVFLENSPRIRTKGRSRILAAFMERRYLVRDGTLAAADVGAPHIRNRWWCLAHLPDAMRDGRQGGGLPNIEGPGHPAPDRLASPIADTSGNGLEVSVRPGGGLDEANRQAIEAVARHTGAIGWNPPHARDCGVVDRSADRIHRIKAIGNGQVPLCAALAWRLLGGPVT